MQFESSFVNLMYVITNFKQSLLITLELYPVLFYVFYISFAASIGSFLGCCFYRLPRSISLFSPKNSFCPKCQKKLEFLDLVPILSYVILRGKCRYCKGKIKLTYFLIETLTVIIFLLGLKYFL